MKKTTIAILLIFIMVSCKIKVNTEIYSSDIVKMVKSNKNGNYLYTRINVEAGEEYRERLTKILSSYFSDIQFLKTEGSGSLNSVLVYKSKTAIIVTNGDEYKTDDSMINFYTSSKGSNYNLGINIKGNMYDSLMTKINEEFSSTVELGELSLEITFINDLGHEIELTPHLVEVDNVPFPFEKQIKLENRDKITISIPLFMKKYIKVNEELNFLKFKS